MKKTLITLLLVAGIALGITSATEPPIFSQTATEPPIFSPATFSVN